jgi:hypothetical protein
MNPFTAALPLLASLTPTATTAPDAEQDEVIIASVSANPLVPSGVVAAAIEISGTGRAGKSRYYLPFMSADQDKPAVGQKCLLDWHRHDGFEWITASGHVRDVRLIDRFSCKAVASR